jgi:hypothetical protein
MHVAVALVVTLSSCRVETLDCAVIVLESQPGLSILTYSDHVGSCKARARVPQTYRLVRRNYVVELSAAQNDSGGLALRATSPAGSSLVLDGAKFMDAVSVGLQDGLTKEGYRYWVLPDWLETPAITFRVVDRANQVLGREALGFAVRRGHERVLRPLRLGASLFTKPGGIYEE